MYSNRPIRRRDAVGRCVLDSRGLGDVDTKVIDAEYRGTTKTGETVVPIVGQVSEMIGKATGTGLIVGMLPKGITKSLGIDMNPASLLLSPMTFGASLLPGVSDILGKAFNVFGGMFKKATHMGDCMKWWSDSNIRGMIAGVDPYSFIFEEYMKKEFPQFVRQYQMMQASGEWGSVGIDSLLNVNNRRNKIQSLFVTLVRQNPDIMTLQCAVQERNETGYTGHTQAQVQEYWSVLKEYARQQEYQSVVQEVDRLLAPFRVKQQWTAIVASRKSNLLVQREGAEKLAMPDNIIGVRRGALVMTTKTQQTSARN